MLEADFGIAEGMVQDKKLDEAAALLVQIIRAQTATADLRANSMFLLGGIYEQKGDIASAIDQYIKIAVFYEGVPKTASEGLWKGGQLLEQQAPSMPDKAKKKGEATKTSQMAKSAIGRTCALVPKLYLGTRLSAQLHRARIARPGDCLPAKSGLAVDRGRLDLRAD